jgi:glycine/D-amino acid oxidase-like deaminating enzyme
MKHNPPLPTYPESLWIQATEELPSFSKLQHDIEVDVAVVGGGIAGITTAYLLAGMKVALLEAGKLLHGTTGHTTAKLTAQHHLIYDELIKQEGQEKAALYYKANEGARKFAESLISRHAIDCGLQTEDAYVFTNSDDYIRKLEDEAAAYSGFLCRRHSASRHSRESRGSNGRTSPVPSRAVFGGSSQAGRGIRLRDLRRDDRLGYSEGGAAQSRHGRR